MIFYYFIGFDIKGTPQVDVIRCEPLVHETLNMKHSTGSKLKN